MALDLVLVTGMSGAGKSTALKMLEDSGFFCVDNLPISLIGTFVLMTSEGKEGKRSHVAVGVDIRSQEKLTDLTEVFEVLQESDVDYRILYLDADDRTLIKRYKESRRNHPLAGNGRLETGIEREREALLFLKKRADVIIDTSQLLTRELRQELEKIFVREQDFGNLIITILSFGFKNGIPTDSDLVFDVRFLKNPYYEQDLRSLTGLDEAVRNYVMQDETAKEFADRVEELIRFLIPHYVREGKNQLVVSIGCTGGRHRSVTLSEELYRRLGTSGEYGLRIEHRDIDRDPIIKRKE